MILQFMGGSAGFSLRILVAGERCNVTEEYFERGSTSEYKLSSHMHSKWRIFQSSKPNEHHGSAVYFILCYW